MPWKWKLFIYVCKCKRLPESDGTNVVLVQSTTVCPSLNSSNWLSVCSSFNKYVFLKLINYKCYLWMNISHWLYTVTIVWECICKKQNKQFDLLKTKSYISKIYINKFLLNIRKIQFGFWQKCSSKTSAPKWMDFQQTF